MKSRRNLFVILLVLLLLAAGSALASQTVEVHVPTVQELQERFHTYDIPAGLEMAAAQCVDGKITVRVDSARTDFVTLGNGLEGLSGTLVIQPPRDGKNYIQTSYYCGMPGYTDQAGMVGMAAGDSARPGSQFYAFFNVPGTLDTNRMMFLPSDEVQVDEYMVRWIADDGTEYYETFLLGSTYTDPSMEPVYLPLRYVTSEMLEPMLDMVANDSFFEKCIIADGELHLFMSETASESVKPLVLNAPAGAVRAEIIHDYQGSVMEVDVENGQAYFYRDMGSESDPFIYCNPNRMSEDNHYMVVWYKADGSILDQGKLVIYTIPYEKKPLFNYAGKWNADIMADCTPVDDSRLKIQNNARNCNIEWSYDQQTGTVHLFRDPNAAANGRPGAVTAYASPENKDWNYARVVSVGGSSILGAGKVDMAWYDLEWKNVQKVQGQGVEVFSETCLTWYKAGPVDVYLQQEQSPYGGGAYLIAWYENENDPWNQPAKLEYLHETIGEMYVESRGRLFPNEQSLTGPVDRITLIKPEAYTSAWNGWELVIRHDPQTGENAKHYEIYMLNDSGAFEKLDLGSERMTLYLPYPDGKTQDGPEEYHLYHFNALYKQKEKLKGEKTPYGVRYEVSSFSPFVMEWTIPEPTPTPTAEPTASPTPTPAATPTATPSPTPTEKPQSPVPFSLTAVPSGLSHLYENVDGLMVDLIAKLTESDAGWKRALALDVKPAYLAEDGKTWIPADESNWPADKPVEVTIPASWFGENFDPTAYTFTVVHMFTKDGQNHKAGETETIVDSQITRNAAEIRFALKGLSPVVVGWTEKTVAATAAPQQQPPQTGDSTPLMALALLAVLSAALCMGLNRKRVK